MLRYSALVEGRPNQVGPHTHCSRLALLLERAWVKTGVDHHALLDAQRPREVLAQAPLHAMPEEGRDVAGLGVQGLRKASPPR